MRIALIAIREVSKSGCYFSLMSKWVRASFLHLKKTSPFVYGFLVLDGTRTLHAPRSNRRVRPRVEAAGARKAAGARGGRVHCPEVVAGQSSGRKALLRPDRQRATCMKVY